MIELLIDYLQEWRKKSDIKEILGISDEQFRQFRQAKEEYNKKYFNHEVDKCLVHSNSKGYKLTSDPLEIISMETDFIKRAKDMLHKAYTSKKTRIENNNYSFEDFLEEQKKFDVESTEQIKTLS